VSPALESDDLGEIEEWFSDTQAVDSMAKTPQESTDSVDNFFTRPEQAAAEKTTVPTASSADMPGAGEVC